MFIPRIYLPESLKVGDNVLASKETSHYLQHVIRCQPHDPIIIFNGQGGEYHAQIEYHQKKIQFIIKDFDPINRESLCEVHLGQSIVRGDRMDFVIQKATELGVQSITPLISQRCIVKIKEAKSEKKMQHWQQIAISASEQCNRTKVPVIHEPIELGSWAQIPFSGTSILLDGTANETIQSLTPSTFFRIAIGPESGWENEECLHLKAQNFIACHLGPRTLRTETAGMVTITQLQSFFGDL